MSMLGSIIKTKYELDASRIRKCELLEHNNQQLIQFIAIGDRHKMMKTDKGDIEIIKLPEQGMEYRYGEPMRLDVALDILDQGSFETHKQIAKQIRSHLNIR